MLSFRAALCSAVLTSVGADKCIWWETCHIGTAVSICTYADYGDCGKHCDKATCEEAKCKFVEAAGVGQCWSEAMADPAARAKDTKDFAKKLAEALKDGKKDTCVAMTDKDTCTKTESELPIFTNDGLRVAPHKLVFAAAALWIAANALP